MHLSLYTYIHIHICIEVHLYIHTCVYICIWMTHTYVLTSFSVVTLIPKDACILIQIDVVRWLRSCKKLDKT